MPTLLKAYLLKTENPFLMLKCYLEDIQKSEQQDILKDAWMDARDKRVAEEKKTGEFSRILVEEKALALKD